MFTTTNSWLFWALLSAFFAALTAVFAKIGIRGVDSDLATLIRASIILIVLALLVWRGNKWGGLHSISSKSWLFLTLSALTTGASWTCYFRALKLGEAFKVAPVDKLSVILVALFGFLFLGERPSGIEWFAVSLVTGGVVLLVFKR